MSSASILVVDDEPQIRRVLRSTLSFRGYTISEVSSGEEAVDLAGKLKPDLILLDVNLPGISGIDTCREIRRSRFPNGLPTGEAVITTGGKLAALYVIHTVGPIYGEEGGKEAER